MKKAFTLMEVNLAVMVMAFGVLGLISLYSLGYRENSQSREDVEAAALADGNLNALVTMLSSTNMTWSAWSSIGTLPADGERTSGWMAYFNVERRDDDNQDFSGADSNPNNKAREVFDVVKGKCSGCEGTSVVFDPGHLNCGLVVYQQGPRCAIAFRASRRAASLIHQPLYYTEVYFQGDTER